MEEVLIIIACLFLNALFAGYEIAFVGISRAEIRRLARAGDKDALRLLELRDRPERTLSIIQIGITLVAALSAAVGGAGAAENLEPWLTRRFGFGSVTGEIVAVLLVVVPLTYFTVVVGELVPKSLALRNATRISMRGARWILLADRVLGPVVSFLEWSTHRILAVIPVRPKPVPEVISSVEIDSLSKSHQQAVLNCVQIERKSLSELLVPWNGVNRVASTDRLEDIVSMVFASGHTRLPVVDPQGNVLGVLHTKEFLALREAGGGDWHAIVRPILRVQTEDSALATLRLMQLRHSHLAVVYSPAGQLMGIVTLEDISEEIWGEIYDEDDDSNLRKVFAERLRSRRARR